MKAVKKVNKNGTFRFELENGEVIVKSTKRNYKAFCMGRVNYTSIKTGLKVIDELNKISATTKGAKEALELAANSGYEKEKMFVVIV
jgi:uncharacterized protein YegP (UPF0339 family)